MIPASLAQALYRNRVRSKNGNGIELESKRCTDLSSSTYIYWFKCKLLRPFTPSPGGESFPSPARQRKWIKELYINYLLSVNERKVSDNAIMIEIISGDIPACPPTSQGVYVRKIRWRTWVHLHPLPKSIFAMSKNFEKNMHAYML